MPRTVYRSAASAVLRVAMVANSPVSRSTAASRCQLSPSAEYPLAITDMDEVCQAKRARHPTSDSAADTVAPELVD